MGFFDWLGDNIGGIFGAGGDAASAAVSAKMAADNRKFQERMTRHRYRYQMQDMQAAGLNPILAFGQSPPGSPPGAMGKVNPRAGSDAVQSALALRKNTEEVKQIASGTQLNKATAALRIAEAAKANVQSELWTGGHEVMDFLKPNSAGFLNKLLDWDIEEPGSREFKQYRFQRRGKENAR